MTDQHPLTDDTCRQLANIRGRLGLAEIDFMRAAADWQLEQVVEWLRDSLQDHKYSGIGILVDYVIEDLREEMRPTTTQEDN